MVTHSGPCRCRMLAASILMCLTVALAQSPPSPENPVLLDALDELRHARGNVHRAELRPAHRAEVRDLGAVGREGRVVELPSGLRVERQVELVGPAENVVAADFGAQAAHAFPALRLGIAAGRAGGVAPAVYNAANEAAVVACIYAFIVELFIHKSMKFKDMKKVVVGSAVTSATLLVRKTSSA